MINFPILHRLFRLMLAFALLAALPQTSPVLAQSPMAAAPGASPLEQPGPLSEGGRLLVDHSYSQSLQLVRAAGGKQLVDYGGFSLWEVPAGTSLAAANQSLQKSGESGLMAAAGLRPLPAPLRLRNTTLLTQSGSAVEPEITPALRQPASTGEQFWLVQFAGPIKPEWVQALTAAGLKLAAYVPEYAYVVWGKQPQFLLESLPQNVRSLVQWSGAYHPAYRLSPALLKLVKNADSAPQPVAEPAAVTVQLFTNPTTKSSLERLLAMSSEVSRAPYSVERFTALTLKLTPAQMAEVAAWSDVFNIEPWNPPTRLDEVQGQILAGNVTTSGGLVVPTAPGYMNFLASHNFPTNPTAYPLVDIVDDGLDIGNAANVLHPDYHLFGRLANPDRVIYIKNCTSDLTGNSADGHGSINAGILAGYNYTTGFPYADALGYQRDLGISPFAQFAATKIFKNGGNFNLSLCGNSYTNFIQAAYAQGTRITSNSWGDGSGFGQYTMDSYEYDVLTRDASPLAGNQEMLHLFAAGNSGQLGLRTISTPGTAKNVLTVGATENVRDQGVLDGCNLSDANSADDLAIFSSRGPTADGRIKPDIMAPGTHVQGAASQDPAYNGSGVCGGANSRYYPDNQTLYTWSSGTSHSTPAVAGVAQLAYEYYKRVFNPGVAPSPAMTKALILNTPRYLNGLNTGGNLPSPYQGWGDANMGSMFDNTARILKDQQQLFTASGQQLVLYGNIADPTRPLHITIAWSDAPGSTTGAAYVNDLDLEVIAGGQIYKGNVFSGANSAPGGSYDGKNNTENVFVPAGAAGSFRVTVKATNIAGDGVPGNASMTDQDYALVIYNGVETADAPVLLLNTAVSFSDSAGNNNGAIDPGEAVTVQVELKNIGTQTAAGITTSVSVLSGLASTGVTNQAAYPDLPGGGAPSSNSPPPYDLKVNLRQPCGGEIWLLQQVNYNTTAQAGLVVGPYITGALASSSISASGLPLTIPDRNYDGLKVTVNVPGDVYLRDVDVRVDITHTFDSDLSLAIQSPTGVERILSASNGGAGDHYTGTIFDDQASDWIMNGEAPFTSRFKPDESFDPLLFTPAGGNWQLHVIDYQLFDTGTLNSFSLDVQTAACVFVAQKFYIPYLNKDPAPTP